MGESRERRRTSWKQGGRGQEEAAWRPLSHRDSLGEGKPRRSSSCTPIG